MNQLKLKETFYALPIYRLSSMLYKLKNNVKSTDAREG